jgi:4-diphosphocytidyl-2-C-methyl-D-erythritol kinase
MSTITLAAPAKLNLALEIIARREDGFHELETIFQTVNLHDLVTVSLSPGDTIQLVCDDHTLPTDQRNLAWRAADVFMRTNVQRHAVSIHLHKRIPHGAGLGGGSSDAAAVLRALARLLPDAPAVKLLPQLASELGSDVAFFLIGGTALGQGRGERLTMLPDLPPQPVTICMPPGSVSTPAAYGALLDHERGPRAPRGAIWWENTVKTQALDRWLHNRLTGPACRLCPAVSELLEWLRGQSLPHLMSGSGAACFTLGHLTEPPPAGVRIWHTQLRPRSHGDDWTR